MSRRPKRSGLFHGFWFELDGRRIGRVKRSELAEAYRLISKHRDIERGLFRKGSPQAPPPRTVVCPTSSGSLPLPSSRPVFESDGA